MRLSYEVETFLHKQDWLEARRGSLGASEMATIMGMGFDSRESLMRQRLSGEEKNLDHIVRVQCGVHLEEYAIQLLCNALGAGGHVLRSPFPWTIAKRRDNPGIHWSPDCMVLTDDGLVPGEVKATKMVKPWKDAYDKKAVLTKGDECCPAIYYAQCQVAMYVTDAPYAHLGAIMNTDEFAHRCIPRNQKWIDKMVEAAHLFLEEEDKNRMLGGIL